MTARRVDRQIMNIYREQFKVFDINGDGFISKMEFKKVMGALGQPVNEANVRDVWATVDKNGDGKIDFNEFVDLMEQTKSQLNGGNQLRDIFRLFDKNGSGLIDQKELELAMTSLGEDITTSEVRDVIKAVDSDRDGKITYREFETLFREAGKSL